MMHRLIAATIVLMCVFSVGAYAYDDHGARDPFWPLISASGTIVSYGQDLSVSDMVLEGIVSDGNGNYTAIINGVIVQAGDMVGLFKIERIEAKKILLSKGNETFELNLKKGGE